MDIQLIDSMGSDLTIVNAARVSLGKTSVSLAPADKRLLYVLASERHGSPFEHVVFQFRIQVPLFVAREWFRHRIGSFNEISGRYANPLMKCYEPEAEEIRQQEGKAMSYVFKPLSNSLDAQEASQAIIQHCTDSIQLYERLRSLGIAREQARSILPQGQYTEFIWTVNLRSLFNFLSLRTAPQALLEIREAANSVELLARQIVPESMAVWDSIGRKAI